MLFPKYSFEIRGQTGASLKMTGLSIPRMAELGRIVITDALHKKSETIEVFAVP